MHRNTFINAPQLLPTLQFKHRPTVLAAGQLVRRALRHLLVAGWLEQMQRILGKSR